MLFNRTLQPKHSANVSFILPTLDRIELNSKDEIFVLKSNQIQIIRLEFYFKAGSWSQEMPFQAYFTNKILVEGTKKYSSKEIAETIDYYGSYYEFVTEKNSASIVFYIPKLFLEKLYPIISDIIFNLLFSEKELSILKEKQKHNIRQQNKKGNVICRNAFMEALYGGNHPYGIIPTEKAVENINTDLLVNFHRNYYLNQNIKIFVAGDVNDNDIKQIEKYFAPKRNIIELLEKKYYEKSTENDNIFIERKDSTQASIRIGKKLFNRLNPDFIDFSVASTILGGYFGSRLMTNIREDKGYTYGINSFLSSLKFSGYFGIATDVGSDVADKAIKEIYYEIDKLQNDLVSENELERVKNYLLGAYLNDFDGAFNIIERYIDIFSYQLDNFYFEKYVLSVKNITSNRILELCQKYMKIDSLTQVVVNKR